MLAQISISSLMPENLSQAAHDVRVEPGKNACRPWIASELQPTSARHAKSSASFSGFELLAGLKEWGWGNKEEEVPRASTWYASQNPARNDRLVGLGLGRGLGTRRQGTPLDY